MAGCFAKNKTPVPIIVVKAESKIAEVYEEITFDLYLYFFSKPSVTKILKSSPRPKIIVANMMFTKLNCKSKKVAKYSIHIQLTAMGKKLKIAISNRPYTRSKLKNTNTEEKISRYEKSFFTDFNKAPAI